MKASELRIGNLVTIDNPEYHPAIKDKTMFVVAIDAIDSGREDSCSLNCTDPRENYIIPAYSQFLKFIKPIPLTPEWLGKFGFGVDTEFDHHFIDNQTLKNDVIRVDINAHYFTVELYRDVFEIPNIKYVHQLQNLYFALTGEELTIKEEIK